MTEGVTIPSLDDLFGGFTLNAEPVSQELPQMPITPTTAPPLPPELVKAVNAQELVQSVEQMFDSLPAMQASTSDNSSAIVAAPANLPTVIEKAAIASTPPQKLETAPVQTAAAANLSVRVDLERLERMNNFVGEISINRNALSLQNAQIQGTVQELLRRFAKFKGMGAQLRALSDQMLVSPEHYIPTSKTNHTRRSSSTNNSFSSNSSFDPTSTFGSTSGQEGFHQTDFDSLEMDSY